MSRWINQNLTAAIIITLLTGYGAGAAVAAVMKADIERLKLQMRDVPENIAVIREQIKSINTYLDKIDRKLDE